MKNVAILGVGKLGSRLAEELIRREACSRLLLWNRSMKKLRGVSESLRLWRDLLGRKAEISTLGWGNWSNVGLVTIVIKEAYDPRDLVGSSELRWLPADLRYVGLPRDIFLVRKLARALEGYRGLVLVLTNPVDLVASLVQLWLPDCCVVGGGLTLDAARLSVIHAREMKSGRREFTFCGEHGPTASLLEDFGSAETTDRLGPADGRFDRLVEEALRSGYRIVEDLGYTLHDCGYVFADDVQWLLHQGKGIRSFSIWSREACIGRPVKWRDGGLVKVQLEPATGIEAAELNVGRLLTCCREEWPDLF